MILTQYDIDKHKAKYLNDIELKNAMNRLSVNADFKRVFLDYYLNSYIIELVNQLSQVNQNTDEFNQIQSKIISTGLLKSFIQNIINNGQLAEISLDELKLIPEEEIEYE